MRYVWYDYYRSNGLLSAAYESQVDDADILKDEVIPGNEYEFEIDLEPTDYTILKGHRIGLIIYSTDVEMTERPIQITNFEIDESTIELILPIK